MEAAPHFEKIGPRTRGETNFPQKVREQRGECSSLWATIEFTVTDFLERAIPWDVAAQPAPDFEVDQRVNW